MNMTGAIRWMQNREQTGDPQHLIDEAWGSLTEEVAQGALELAQTTEKTIASLEEIFTEIQESAQTQVVQMQDKQNVLEENVRRLTSSKEQQCDVSQKMKDETQRMQTGNASLQRNLQELIKDIQAVPPQPSSQVVNRGLQNFAHVACSSLAGHGDNLQRSKTGVIMGPRKFQ